MSDPAWVLEIRAQRPQTGCWKRCSRCSRQNVAASDEIATYQTRWSGTNMELSRSKKGFNVTRTSPHVIGDALSRFRFEFRGSR
jgi:hypothetical protein